MVKLLIAGRRAPGQTRRGAHDHLRDIHAKMVVCPPPDAGAMPADYVQNHVFDGAYPGAGDHAIERDLVTELWFEDFDHLTASTTTPYYLAQLKPDEPHFVDDATVVKMPVQVEPVSDGARGPFKAFFFQSADAALPVADGGGAVIRNVVLPGPGGGAPFVDVVIEAWFTTADNAREAITRWADALPADDARARSFAVAAEEHDTARLRACHGCA